MRLRAWFPSVVLATTFVACSPLSPTGRVADAPTAPAAGPVTPPEAPAEASAPAPPPEPAPVAAAAPPEDEPLLPPVDTRWGNPRPEPRGGAEAHADASGAGGLGLSGIGEGGGGRGEGVGLGAVGALGSGPSMGSAPGIGAGAGTGSGAGFGSGHGRLSGAHRTAPPSVRMGAASVSGSGAGATIVGGAGAGVAAGSAAVAGSAPQPFAGVRAGEWDDNANFRDFLKWLAAEPAPGVPKLDLRARRFVVVRDAKGRAVPSCPVEIQSPSGVTETLLTTSTGRALLLPFADGFHAGALTATARCDAGTAVATFDASPGDAVVGLTLPGDRVETAAPAIDIAFVLDTTGSMAEEIDALRDTLSKVAASLSTLGVRPRVGLVEYKDRTDEYVTRLHPMTTDLGGLEQRIAHLSASGGGDTPEHVSAAVRVAVSELRWKPSSVARLVFLIGDAPPHLDYADDPGYAAAVADASHRGIQFYTIAASGMDRVGQVVFRQIAERTGGTHLFVLRGGAGPQSTGGGDALSGCGGTHDNYTSGNLDELVLSKIRSAIAAKDADPMRIAGLGQDENAKPCSARVVAQQ